MQQCLYLGWDGPGIEEGLLLMGIRGRLLSSLLYFLTSVPPSFLSLSSPESSLLSPPQRPKEEKQGSSTLNIDITLGLAGLTCELFTL